MSLGVDIEIASNSNKYINILLNIATDLSDIKYLKDKEILTLPERKLKIFNLLIDYGVDINLQKSGNTLLNEVYVPIDEATGQNLFRLLELGADITIESTGTRLNFLNLLNSGSQITKIAERFVEYVLQAEDINVIKGAENALLIAVYLNNCDSVNTLLRKGVWFRSEKNELYCRNLIQSETRGNMRTKSIFYKYYLERKRLINENTSLIPDLNNIVCGY
ncbi:MAG: hypothetical protein P4L22_06160 [Candidatus Babeliales bacterium]|nr:hypothetical protein [Candidatus Babeliales bacterium]